MDVDDDDDEDDDDDDDEGEDIGIDQQTITLHWSPPKLIQSKHEGSK